jgi:hypothetical protein
MDFSQIKAFLRITVSHSSLGIPECLKVFTFLLEVNLSKFGQMIHPKVLCPVP